MKEIMQHKNDLLRTAFLLVWIGIFSFSSSAWSRPLIDEEGNIILPDDEGQETIETRPEPQRRPSPPPPPVTKPTPPSDTPDKKEAQEVQKTQEVGSPAPEETLQQAVIAAVRAERVDLRRHPDPRAQSMAILRRGQQVQVRGFRGDFARVRFLLDEGFPLEGWLPTDSLLAAQGGEAPMLEQVEQHFRRQAREESEIPVFTEFPEQLSELPIDDQLIPSAAPLPIERRGRARTSPRRWELELSPLVGQWRESFVTKLDGEDYAEAPFLDYKIAGIGIHARLSLEIPNFLFFPNFRFFSDYEFIFFDAQISPSPGVERSDILAQWHEIGFGGEVSHHWKFDKIGVRAIGRLSPQFQYLNTNSLIDSQNRTPLLYSHWAAYLRSVLAVQVDLPWDLEFQPEFHIQLFYLFNELATGATSSGQLLRTGAPEMKLFNFSFGAHLRWNLQMLDYENSFLRLGVQWRDYSRSFSDEGNRAAVATQDAQSSSQLVTIGLGIDHRF